MIYRLDVLEEAQPDAHTQLFASPPDHGVHRRHDNQEDFPMPAERPASWSPAYPALCRLVDAAIEDARATRSPAASVTALRRVRRDLAGMDNGHLPYPDSQPGWSPHAAFRLIRQVITAAPLGHPAVGTVLRLAADIADQNAAARAAAASAKDR